MGAILNRLTTVSLLVTRISANAGKLDLDQRCVFGSIVSFVTPFNLRLSYVIKNLIKCII